MVTFNSNFIFFSNILISLVWTDVIILQNDFFSCASYISLEEWVISHEHYLKQIELAVYAFRRAVIPNNVSPGDGWCFASASKVNKLEKFVNDCKQHDFTRFIIMMSKAFVKLSTSFMRLFVFFGCSWRLKWEKLKIIKIVMS